MLTAWWIYRRLGGGARSLNDPQSAVLFVLVVPGLTALLFAALHAFVGQATLGDWADFPQRMAQVWLSQALGFLAVAAPLLTAATPWLVRRGLVRPEAPTRQQSAESGHAGADPLTRGDAIEIAGLALGAGLLALLLACTYGRQGLGGLAAVGCAAAVDRLGQLAPGTARRRFDGRRRRRVPLVLPGVVSGRTPRDGTSSLSRAICWRCAAPACWRRRRPVGCRINETRYRQMVTHVPVVVYSGRLLPGQRGRLDAEVTLVSAASGAMLGCPPEHLLGDHQRWLEARPPGRS